MTKLLQLYRKSPNAFFYLLGMFVFLMFFILTVWGDDGVFHLVRLQNEKNKLAKSKHRILLENLQLATEIKTLKEGRFVEQSIREDLGYIRPNETVYLIPKN